MNIKVLNSSMKLKVFPKNTFGFAKKNHPVGKCALHTTPLYVNDPVRKYSL